MIEPEKSHQFKDGPWERLSTVPPAVCALMIAVGLAIPTPLSAQFVKTNVIPLPDQAMGITFDGSVWRITSPVSTPGRWSNYDENFTFIDSVILDGTSDTRGLTYDSLEGTLFVSDNKDAVVYEYTLDGTILQQFNSSPGPNALAFDESDNTIWIAHFSGLVEHRSRTGILLDSFFIESFAWTGLTIDSTNDTLFLLDDGDFLFEFAKDGTFISQLLDEDEIDDNGLGLYYDSANAMLYATSQSGFVSIFHDSSRNLIFFDGFESGDTSAWSITQP